LFGLPLVYLLAPKITEIASGETYPEVVTAFRLLLLAVFFTSANAFRVQYFLISGKQNIFAKIHVFMGITGTILTFLCVYWFSYKGPGIAISIVALGVLVVTNYYSNTGRNDNLVRSK
jgi:O-antigen/teichoic acid export membrane protein